MNQYITIPLSKKGKHAGQYEVIVDECDKDLASYEWSVLIKARTYARRSNRLGINRRETILIHQVILERMIGRPLAPHEMVDHINRNGLDNRRENLRLATNEQNTRNAKIRKDSTSGVKGVRWRKDNEKWQARIQHNGKRIVVGNYDNLEDAKQAYKEASLKYHKEFASYTD